MKFPHKRIRLNWIPATASLFMVLAMHGDATAQQSSSKWVLSETDCQIAAQYWLVSKSVDEFRTAPDCDQVHFKAGYGTKILVAKPIEPAFVIRELAPSVWIKATRPQIQLLVRVVLPHTQDPNRSGPMTVLLPGPVYRDTNQWRKLDFADSGKSLVEALEPAVWKLRAKYPSRVDERDAYVDKLVLNVYSGPGTSTVWIDDDQVLGAVDASRVAVRADTVRFDPQIKPVGHAKNQDDSRRPALAQCHNTVLEVGGQPFFARVIQHQGEPFEQLKELGFNTIELPDTATVQQLRHAQQLDMWIICPPPESAGLHPISAEYDRVLAWSAGQGLTEQDVSQIQTLRQEVQASDFRLQRPMVGHVDSDLFGLSRELDILCVGFEPIGGSFILSQYSDWIRQRTALADKTLPLWATIQTELPTTIATQTAAMAGRVPPLPLEPAQLKFMAYEAIAGGARGLRFVSRSRLDADDPMARLRRWSLRWLNRHLDQLHPWVCGGTVVNRNESRDRSSQMTTLATDRARLVLIQRTTQREQWVAGELPVTNYLFTDHSLTSSEQPYHLTENGLIPLSQGRAMVGNEITIDPCTCLEAVVITQEPQVISRLAESYLVAGSISQSQMHLTIAQQWLAISQLINDQLVRTGQRQATASGLINEANNALRQAQALISNGSAMTASRLLAVADQKLAAARSAILFNARSQFSPLTSNPLLTHVSLVPIHFGTIDRIAAQPWQPNGLSGGDFEDLQHMTENGWENHRSEIDHLRTRVELVPDNVVHGQRALMMQVASTAERPGSQLVDRTPLWIKSAKVPVKAGQLVRIHGWINVPRPISGSLDGLMIMDSIGGPALGERILVTDGWQEFTLYRSPAEDSQLQLTLALTGVGQAMVDQINVRVLELNAAPPRQARAESEPDQP